MSTNVVDINSLSQFNTVIASATLSVVIFIRPSKIPTRTMGKIFDKLSLNTTSYPFNFYKVDVDAHNDIATSCGIDTPIPCFKFYKNGSNVDNVLSCMREEFLVAGLERNS